MSKALISTLVAAAFASSAPASAHTRELLFGPPLEATPTVPAVNKRAAPTGKKVTRHIRKEGPKDVAAPIAESRVAASVSAPATVDSTSKKGAPAAKVAEPVKPNVIVAAVATKPEPRKPVKADVAKSIEATKPAALAAGPKAPAAATPTGGSIQAPAAAATKPAALVAAAPSAPALKVLDAASKKPAEAVAATAPASTKAPLVAEPPKVSQPAIAVEAPAATAPRVVEASDAERPLFETSAPDEQARFLKLQKSLTKGTTIGIMPGMSRAQTLSYENNANFLPLTNYLSEKNGFLFSPLYETRVKDFRHQILEGRYPIIFIPGSMADAAVKGGYEPLVMNTVSQSAVFVVRANSRLKTITHLKTARLTMPMVGASATAALTAMIRIGAQDTVMLIDSYTESRAIDEVLAGRADAAVVGSADAEALAEKYKGALRIIGSAPNTISYTYWVRKGAYDSATKAKLISSLTAVANDPSLGSVREGLKRATRMDTKYAPLTEDRVKEAIDATNLVNTKWPALATIDQAVSEEAVAKNKAMPVFFPLTHPSSDDALAVHDRLEAKFDRGTTIGVMTDGASASRFYHFKNDLKWFPLTNFVSEKAGFLVNPVYASNLKDFRVKVLEGQFPMVYIPGSLADAAVKGGYEPLVGTEHSPDEVFVVPAGSAIKSPEDLRESRIAIASSGSNVAAALGKLIHAGAHDKVQISTGASPASVYEDMLAGRVDAAVVSSSLLRDLDEKSMKEIRVIATVASPLANSYWVRKGAYDDASKAKLAAALVETTSPGAPETVRSTAKQLMDNQQGKYVQLGRQVADEYVATMDLINAKWPALGGQDKPVSAGIVEKNAKSSAFFRMKH